MKLKKYLLLTLLAVPILGINLLPVTSANAQVVIKYSSGQQPSNPKNVAAKRFGELIEARTNGEVKFEFFFSAQLFKDRAEPQAVRLGQVDMVTTAYVFMDAIVPDTQIYGLPFMFGVDPQVTKRLAQSPIGRGIEESIEKRLDVKVLGTWLSGVTMYVCNRAVHTPADFKGLRIRVAGSKLWEEYTRALGANPMAVSAGEMVTAAQQGVIDCIDSNSNALASRKIWQVLNYGIKTSQSTIVHAVMVNGKVWRDLSAAHQKAFEDVAAEIVDWEWDQAISSLVKNDQIMIDAGMDFVIPTAEVLEMFRQKIQPLQEPFLAANTNIDISLVRRAEAFVK